MSDTTANQSVGSAGPATIAAIVDGVEAMGDLGRFVIDDLSPDEEDAFFRTLEGA